MSDVMPAQPLSGPLSSWRLWLQLVIRVLGTRLRVGDEKAIACWPEGNTVESDPTPVGSKTVRWSLGADGEIYVDTLIRKPRRFREDQFIDAIERPPGGYIGPPIDRLSILEQAAVEHGLIAKPPRPQRGGTPARIAHLKRLVEGGYLSPEEADRLAPDGRVTNAVWEELQSRFPNRAG